jgi:cold shock CspA family protein
MTAEPQITFRNMEHDPQLEDHIRKEIAKLERYFHGILTCRILVERPARPEHGPYFHVRIDLGVPNDELIVKHEPSLHGTLADLQEQRTTKSSEAARIRRDSRRAVLEAFREIRRRLQDYVRRIRGDVKQHEPAGRATVAKLYPQQDYGFLEDRDGREVYFHRRSVLNRHFDRLVIGSRVAFVEEKGEKGPQASTVRLIHPRKKMAAQVPLAASPQGRFTR